jgi:phosphoribosylformimino-5-aminoimidazole carboxamide ribotide isomerase
MRFRPCIDLHNGKVKQIVGSTLRDNSPESLRTNFTAAQPASFFAELYKRDKLTGGHIIMLGPGNEQAASEALRAYPQGMHVGGGITPANASGWLARGAAAVIVTSYVFQKGRIHQERLVELATAVGRENLVIDLSCRRKGDEYYVVTDRWQNWTEVVISRESLAFFAGFCAEFLIHAADVEGKCAGIDTDLVAKLGRWATLPITYAGGVRDLSDLELVRDYGRNRVDVTVGSSLDIFGGTGMKYEEAVAFHHRCQAG